MVNNDSTRSFTLIELLVVTAIMLVTTGLSIASYNNYTEDRRLEGETKKTIAMLYLAHKKAISGDASQCIDPAASILDYRIAFTANSLIITPTCSQGTTNSINLTLDSNVIFNPVPNTVVFESLTGKIPAQIDLLIYNNKISPSRCKKITISPAGVINPAASCP